jgi:uncharacterized protein (DUF885 family)
MSELADAMLDLVFDEDPIFATLVGIRGWDDRLRDLSAEADLALRVRAEDIRGSALAAGDNLTTAVVLHQADWLVRRIDARLVEHTFSDLLAAPVMGLLSALPHVQPTDERGRRDYLTRLAAIPEFLAQATGRHREGVATGLLPLAHLVLAAAERVERYLADPALDPFLAPELAPEQDAERDRLLAEVVRPAFAAYLEVLRVEIAPHGRAGDRPGLCWLPDGEAAYAGLVRVYTTTDRTPAELHQTGLDLIAGLAREYEEIGSRVFGPCTVEQVRERLRTDPALKWRDAEEMLAVARVTIERAEGVAPEWFGRLPRGRCAVEQVPDADAPNAPSAFYMDPAMDGSRPGTYFVNIHRAEEQHRIAAEALAFHEAVPGHHFQLGLAQEFEDLPVLRRVASIEAYLEGWALYAERLADEMGLYSDDLARLGMLAGDSVRAARLVVDTGIHAFGWTRDQVVDFLRANTVMSEVEVQSESDRYIERPAQALAYMVGRLEIQRLRGEAAARMGEAFDLKAFHDLVLSGGPLPMAVLADVVGRWSESV